MISRRHLLLSSFATTASVTAWSQATPFPIRPIKIVVPFGAGGVADLTARIVGQKLGEILDQSVVVENKPGAGGVVAADSVAKAQPDGYTLLLMSNGNAVSVNLFKILPYDTLNDFTPLAILGTFDLIVVVPAESKFKSLAELVKFGKANPGKLNIGSINIGSTQNLSAELLKTTAGIQAQVVPFNGTPAVISALRGGQIDVAVEVLSPALTHIKSGALRALATTGSVRSAALPEVATAKEAGLNLVATSWNALAAPARTPQPVVDKLNTVINKALSDTVTRARLYALNVSAQGGSTKQARELLISDVKRWGEVIQRAGITRQ